MPLRSIVVEAVAALLLGLPVAGAGARPSDRVVWVALEGAGQIAKVDVTEGIMRRARTNGGGPHNITVAPDGTVAVALWASDAIMLFRDGRRTFVDLGGHPHDVKIARNMVVVANQTRARVQLVRLDGTFIRRIRLKADPHDLAVDPQQRHAWVTLEGSDDIAVVDLLDRDARVRYVDTDARPHDILFAPDGRLWVTDWGGALHVYEGRRARHVRSIPLGEEAHHLDFTPDGRFCWITDHDARALFVVRVRMVRVVDRIRFPSEPHHVTVLANGRRVVVADHANDRLVLYEPQTRRRLKAITIGRRPHGVWAVGS
jgi:DNA-binding beta-propeller fold protein YncE